MSFSSGRSLEQASIGSPAEGLPVSAPASRQSVHARFERSFQRLVATATRVQAEAPTSPPSDRKQLTTLLTAGRSIAHGITVAHIGSATLSRLHAELHAMVELARTAKEDTVATPERGSMQRDLDAKLELLLSTVDGARVGTLALFQDAADLVLQVGVGTASHDRLQIDIGPISFASFEDGASDLSLASPEEATDTHTILEEAIDVIECRQASFAQVIAHLQRSVATVDTLRTNLSAASSMLRDINDAAMHSQLAYEAILRAGKSAVEVLDLQAPPTEN